MKILSGAVSKDNGKIVVDGKQAEIRSTHDSKKLGIDQTIRNILETN